MVTKGFEFCGGIEDIEMEGDNNREVCGGNKKKYIYIYIDVCPPSTTCDCSVYQRFRGNKMWLGCYIYCSEVGTLFAPLLEGLKSNASLNCYVLFPMLLMMEIRCFEDLLCPSCVGTENCPHLSKKSHNV